MRFPIAFPGKGYRRCRSHLERKILSGQTCRLINSELGARYKREGAEGPFLFINIACITRVFKKRRWTCWSQQLRSSPCCAWSPAPPGRPGRRTLLHSSQRLVGWFWGALLPRTADPILQRILMSSPYPTAGSCPFANSSYTLAQWPLVKNRFCLRRGPDHGTARVVLAFVVVVVGMATLHFRIKAQYERR